MILDRESSTLPFNRHSVPHVFVNFSGGKDSLASLLVALKRFDRHQVTAVFDDTGAELPATYEYLRRFNDLVFPVKRLAHRVTGQKTTARGVENVLELVELDWADPVGSRGALTLLDLIAQRHEKAPDSPGWPSPANRYCTRALKSQIAQKYIRQRMPDMEVRSRCVLVMGIRREESPNRANTPFWGFDPDLGIMNWFPVVDWSRDQVIKYIQRWGIPLNPVYEVVSRANCGICFFAGRREIVAAERAYPGYLAPYVEMEKRLGRTWTPDVSLGVLQGIASGEIPDQLPLFEGMSEAGLSCTSGFCEV